MAAACHLEICGGQNLVGLRAWHVLLGIEEDDGIFRITFHQKAETQGFKEDKEKRITFPPGTTADEVIDRMIEILQGRRSTSAVR